MSRAVGPSVAVMDVLAERERQDATWGEQGGFFGIRTPKTRIMALLKSKGRKVV